MPLRLAPLYGASRVRVIEQPDATIAERFHLPQNFRGTIMRQRRRLEAPIRQLEASAAASGYAAAVVAKRLGSLSAQLAIQRRDLLR